MLITGIPALKDYTSTCRQLLTKMVTLTAATYKSVRLIVVS